MGFQNFLGLFKPYSVLFGATFIVITANLAIERLGLMAEANTNAFKVGNRNQWTQVVREFFGDIIEGDPFMCKELMRHLMPIHDYLYCSDYRITSKEKATEFFNRFFSDRVHWFEEMNTLYVNTACYPNREHSFSWINFRYILYAMVNIDDSYETFIEDFEKLYQQKVLENIDNKKIMVDQRVFNEAVQKYHDWKQQQQLLETVKQMRRI